MQLFALDQEGQLIHALEARKKIPYRCPECLAEVRRRSGKALQPHFFHRRSRECRHEAKSLEHLHVQLRIHSELSGSVLERRFESPRRVADICSEEHKLIIEVQCSAMNLEELKARTRDYESLGYRVLWILHCKRYYQKTVQPIEHFLEEKPHYFTTINKEGEGLIFDQLSEIRLGERRVYGEPLAISFASWPLQDLSAYRRQRKKPALWKQRLWGYGQTALRLLLENACSNASRG